MPDRRKGRCAASRVAVPQGNDFVIAGREFRSENGSIVSFGAAVRKERFLQIAGRDLSQLLRQIALRPVGVERRGVRDLIDLIFPRLINTRIGVADADGQHTAKTIEIPVALIVPDVFALAFDQSERLLIIGRHGREKKFLVLTIRHSRDRRFLFTLVES